MADLEPHQLRVVAEKADLDEKLAKLATFLSSEQSDSVDSANKRLLYAQRIAMTTYSRILAERIALFTSQPIPAAWNQEMALRFPAHHPV